MAKFKQVLMLLQLEAMAKFKQVLMVFPRTSETQDCGHAHFFVYVSYAIVWDIYIFD